MDRDQLTIRLINEQRDWRFVGRIVVVCPWCGYPGGSGPPPDGLTDDERKHWGAMDRPHEWLIKRGANIPDNAIFTPINTVLLHRKCHSAYGQTKEMAQRCYAYKAKIYGKGAIGKYIETLKGNKELTHAILTNITEEWEG